MECYIIFMRHQQFVLPMQCKRCGSTFDLWHDLLKQGEGKEEIYEALSDMKENFCWKCRKFVAGEMDFSSIGNEIEVSQENEDDFDLHWS